MVSVHNCKISVDKEMCAFVGGSYRPDVSLYRVVRLENSSEGISVATYVLSLIGGMSYDFN